MALSTGSIAAWIKDSIYNIPTTVDSGTNITDWVNKGLRYVQNYTGETISTTDVPTKYQTVLTNLGCAYTLAKMVGTNVDFNVRVGEFTASKIPPDSPEAAQMTFYMDQANEELKSIGRKTRYAKVYG